MERKSCFFSCIQMKSISRLDTRHVGLCRLLYRNKCDLILRLLFATIRVVGIFIGFTYIFIHNNNYYISVRVYNYTKANEINDFVSTLSRRKKNACILYNISFKRNKKCCTSVNVTRWAYRQSIFIYCRSSTAIVFWLFTNVLSHLFHGSFMAFE